MKNRFNGFNLDRYSDKTVKTVSCAQFRRGPRNEFRG